MDISRHPLLEKTYEACIAVGALPPCESQTAASKKINELMEILSHSISAPIPKIGEQWPGQGGVNAGLMRGTEGKPDYFLIISTDPAGQKNELEWGAYSTEAEDSNCEFDGLHNTTSLLKAETSHPAAEFAASVVIDGHNDFYLPARRELSLMYANCPEMFKNRWHWSSTQYSARSAWTQYFEDGSQVIDRKGSELAVRAVRRYYPLSNSAI